MVTTAFRGVAHPSGMVDLRTLEGRTVLRILLFRKNFGEVDLEHCATTERPHKSIDQLID
jgi:hypothetical protein